MSGRELEPRREQLDGPYIKTARYGSDQIALEAYQKAQGVIFAANCGLSAYRIRYKEIAHVVVLGDRPVQDVEDKLFNALKDGQGAELPQDIIATLVQRRFQAQRVGPWVEGHYRPGIDL